MDDRGRTVLDGWVISVKLEADLMKVYAAISRTRVIRR